MHLKEMIKAHPQVQGETADSLLLRCIEECYACTQTCTSCADACLAEDNVKELLECIRRNLDCSDICATTGAVATRQTGSSVEVLRAVVQACVEACRVCAEECRKHAAHHEHCRICADACDKCEKACRAALSQIH